jgi:hypothetical protein
VDHDALRAVHDPAASGSIRVTRWIAAPAGTIFVLLTNPRRHVDLDGSAMVRRAVTEQFVTDVGQVFVMSMYNPELGYYEMNNHVVAFQRDRLLAWEPEAGRGHPNAHANNARWGQRWTYALVPDEPGATFVTEIYDCTRIPAVDRERMNNGAAWIEAMTSSLRRLDEVCVAHRERQAVADSRQISPRCAHRSE